jgi:carboxyl-terminal processing protease
VVYAGRTLDPEGTQAHARWAVRRGAPRLAETDSARKARPTYKSTAGRLLYGGGAITPDIFVKPDTFTTPEQVFLRSTATKAQDIYVTLYDYAFELKDKVRPDFQVQPAWRDELYTRLQKKGVEIDRAMYDGAARYLDREIERRVARLAFGDSAVRRRTLPDDPQLQKAIEILKKNPSTRELIALASSQARR